uniref:Uncharacterized protein n=1 Tax=Arundo donax TaxID=35708 RepID=A0A0A9DDT7_ARUDO
MVPLISHLEDISVKIYLFRLHAVNLARSLQNLMCDVTLTNKAVSQSALEPLHLSSYLGSMMARYGCGTGVSGANQKMESLRPHKGYSCRMPHVDYLLGSFWNSAFQITQQPIELPLVDTPSRGTVFVFMGLEAWLLSSVIRQ